MPYVDHKFGKTYFQVRGSKRARGLPLVCLHGGPGGYSRYMTDLFALSGDRQVFIYDQIGGGRSSEIASPRWTIKTFVDELKHLRAAWGLDQFQYLALFLDGEDPLASVENAGMGSLGRAVVRPGSVGRGQGNTGSTI